MINGVPSTTGICCVYHFRWNYVNLAVLQFCWFYSWFFRDTISSTFSKSNPGAIGRQVWMGMFVCFLHGTNGTHGFQLKSHWSSPGLRFRRPAFRKFDTKRQGFERASRQFFQFCGSRGQVFPPLPAFLVFEHFSGRPFSRQSTRLDVEQLPRGGAGDPWKLRPRARPRRRSSPKPRAEVSFFLGGRGGGGFQRSSCWMEGPKTFKTWACPF